MAVDRLYSRSNRELYYQCPTWEAIRFTKMRLAGWICEWPGCQQPCSQVHHLTEERFGGLERMTDLLAVCRFHHEKAHWQTPRRRNIIPLAKQLTLDDYLRQIEQEDDFPDLTA